MNSHKIVKGFKKGISRGKVKAKTIPMNEESEPKTVKLTGYRLFIQNKISIIRDQNPDATPQEMAKLLNEACNNKNLLEISRYGTRRQRSLEEMKPSMLIHSRSATFVV